MLNIKDRILNLVYNPYFLIFCSFAFGIGTFYFDSIYCKILGYLQLSIIGAYSMYFLIKGLTSKDLGLVFNVLISIPIFLEFLACFTAFQLARLVYFL